MEVSAAIFIPLMIIAVTQMIKMASPIVQGWMTISVALVLGVLTALFDTHIGLADITVAQGIVLALGAVGITTAAGKAGGGTTGDSSRL